MLDLKKLEKYELVDLLAKETTRYYKMSTGAAAKEDYDQCKETIEEIQIEISRRVKEKKKS